MWKPPCLLFLAAVMLSVESMLLLWIPELFCPRALVFILVGLGLFVPSAIGAVLAFSLGLLMDFSAGLLVGPWAGAYVTVFAVLAALSHRLFVESRIVIVVATFAASMGGDLVFYLLTLQQSTFSWDVLGDLTGRAIVSAMCAPWLVQRVSSFLSEYSNNSQSQRLGGVGG
jgi:cell shape-determining protein MreD